LEYFAQSANPCTAAQKKKKKKKLSSFPPHSCNVTSAVSVGDMAHAAGRMSGPAWNRLLNLIWDEPDLGMNLIWVCQLAFLFYLVFVFHIFLCF
jgi:hypothetical protein